MDNIISRPPISREYGAWASIGTAFIAGIGIAGRVNAESLILLAGALSFFLARMPFLSLLRSISSGRTAFSGFTRQAVWFVFYLFIGLTLFSILLSRYKLTALFIFIVVSLIIFSY